MLRQRVALSSSRLRTGSGNLPDPAGLANDGGSSSDEDDEGREGWGVESAACEKKPWMRVDKRVYEEQLEKLQEQLVHAMLENQSLQGE